MTDLEEPGSTASGTTPEPPTGPRRHARSRSAKEQDATKNGTPRSRGMSALRESVIVLGSALVISLLIKTFLVQAFFIPSESMEPVLHEGDRVLVSRLVPGPLDLHRGDVVVFVDPGDWLGDPQASMNPVQRGLITAGEWIGLLPANTGSHLIKRVIGMPGDHVVCCDDGGQLTVNGVAIAEPYVMPGAEPSKTAFDVVVPEGKLWVLGDNRANSGDSRAHMGDPGGGFVPIDEVIGVAQVRIWPLNRLAILRNPGATFAGVPDP